MYIEQQVESKAHLKELLNNTNKEYRLHLGRGGMGIPCTWEYLREVSFLYRDILNYLNSNTLMYIDITIV